MMQVYTAKTEERARKLNNDICEAFAGSKYFQDDRLVVTPVGPIYNGDLGPFDMPTAYCFWVFFDTVEFDADVQADILIDRHSIIRNSHGQERHNDKNN